MDGYVLISINNCVALEVQIQCRGSSLFSMFKSFQAKTRNQLNQLEDIKKDSETEIDPPPPKKRKKQPDTRVNIIHCVFCHSLLVISGVKSSDNSNKEMASVALTALQRRGVIITWMHGGLKPRA